MQAKTIALLLVLCPLAAAAAGETAPPFPDALLKGDHRKPVKEVVEDFTLHREMSGLRVLGRQAVFELLLTHPDFAASLARAAGVLKYTVKRQGVAAYWANDHKGITGRLEILQAEAGQMVLYAQGRYKKGIIRIPGRLAMVVHSTEGKNPDGPYVENSLSGYVRVDGALLDPLARLFRPLVVRIMEKRVHWFFRKVNKLMKRLRTDPEAILQKLDPDAWREEIAELRLLLDTSQTDLGRHPRTAHLGTPRNSASRTKRRIIPRWSRVPRSVSPSFAAATSS
ncbi:MAG: hypothetical protein ACE5IQ_11185 [Candidatus Methylomirabilales bacterium]